MVLQCINGVGSNPVGRFYIEQLLDPALIMQALLKRWRL
jgi:hypothetical protein